MSPSLVEVSVVPESSEQDVGSVERRLVEYEVARVARRSRQRHRPVSRRDRVVDGVDEHRLGDRVTRRRRRTLTDLDGRSTSHDEALQEFEA